MPLVECHLRLTVDAGVSAVAAVERTTQVSARRGRGANAETLPASGSRKPAGRSSAGARAITSPVQIAAVDELGESECVCSFVFYVIHWG